MRWTARERGNHEPGSGGIAAVQLHREMCNAVRAVRQDEAGE
jgi:hypothetical protein